MTICWWVHEKVQQKAAKWVTTKANVKGPMKAMQ